jgi:hypothetical protein
MVHISPWDATLGLKGVRAAILPPASPIYPYGPYKREGFATIPSNQACESDSEFDPFSLRQFNRLSPIGIRTPRRMTPHPCRLRKATGIGAPEGIDSCASLTKHARDHRGASGPPSPYQCHGEQTQASALQAIMLQVVQKVLAGSTPASRTYLQYQEFAARQSTKATELRFDDEQDGRVAGIALKEKP